MTPLTALSSFLAGYLHQDWDLEYSDSTAAAKEFASSESPALVIDALGELAMLNASPLGEIEIEAVLVATGCYYRPNEIPVRDWLIALEREVGATLWSRLA